MLTGWTTEKLMQLPWTYRGPSERTEGDKVCYVITIEEMQDFIVAGNTEEEVIQELPNALAAFFDSYTDDGEPVPEPSAGTRPAWGFAMVSGRGRVREAPAITGATDRESKSGDELQTGSFVAIP